MIDLATRVQVASSPTTTTTSSRPGSSIRSSGSSSTEISENEDYAWHLMDALYFPTARSSICAGDESISIDDALADPSGGVLGMSLANSAASLYPFDQTADIPHFPELSLAMLGIDGEEGTVRTSEPINVGNKEDQEYELSRVVNRQRFQDLLDAPMGMRRFSEWVDEEGSAYSKAVLQLYIDVRAYGALVKEVEAVTEGLQAMYFGSKGLALGSLASQPSHCLPALGSAYLGMNTVETEAFDRLLALEFKRFITGKMTEQVKAKMELFPAHGDRGDVGEVFCVADPRRPDQPLVLVSDGFCRLSGYSRKTLVGRNCRFLQGKGTDAEAVRLLREAIASGKEHTSLLLNYTRTGTPFWNLLNIIPLRNAKGGVDYFIAAQVDVSQAVASRKAFDVLTGVAKRDDGDTTTGRLTFSSDLIKYTENRLGTVSAFRHMLRPSGEVPLGTDTIPVPPPDSPKPSIRKSKWITSLRTKSSENLETSDDCLLSTPHSQKLPIPIQEHVTTFSSAYSKLIIFDARDRKIQYVTPPLLAHLGYTVKSAKDRLSPLLLSLDILDLIVAQNENEAKATKTIVRQVIEEGETHSLFAGLALAQTRRTAYMPDFLIDGVTPDGRKFARCLLHLTPMKDDRDVIQTFVVAVG